MIGRRVSMCLALISALSACALASQGASAAKSVNTTMFTCIMEPSSKGDFDDAHCDKSNPGKGKFTHSLIPLDTTTEMDATNEKVTAETKEPEPAVLKSTVNLAKTTIECTVVKGNTQKSLVHNVETEGKHTLTGVAAAEYSGCNVTQPAKCSVAEPIIAEAIVTGVEKLGPGKSEMGIEFTGKGEEETLAVLEYKNKGEESCPLKGVSAKVKGSAIATSGPTTESIQTNEWGGSTLVFTPKSEMQKLKVGKEAAEFTSIITPRMSGACGGSAISATTVT
jgi:hypothetical protein